MFCLTLINCDVNNVFVDINIFQLFLDENIVATDFSLNSTKMGSTQL